MSDCVFCRIAAGELPATVVRESERTISFRDLSPQAPTHVLVITREHHPDLAALTAAEPGTAAELLREAYQVAIDDGIADSGYRVVFNTGPDAGQAVHHVHAHVLGGHRLGHLG
jgi:histidine triad (HIT) family protein